METFQLFPILNLRKRKKAATMEIEKLRVVQSGLFQVLDLFFRQSLSETKSINNCNYQDFSSFLIQREDSSQKSMKHNLRSFLEKKKY